MTREREVYPLAPYPPLIVNVCLTGMVPSRDKTPYVPLSPEEIVADAVRVCDAGAQIVHIHARDETGAPTWRAEIYERILSGIRRERPGLICGVSTSGRLWSDFGRRAEVLSLDGAAKPDMASLTLGSLNFHSGPSINSIDTVKCLAETMLARGIKAELEAFEIGMIEFAHYLLKQGLVGGRPYFNLLLGSLGTISATIGNLASMITALPPHAVWSAAGIGVFQLPMNVAAIIAGGGVRVGIEDSIYFDAARTRLATNEALVQRVVRIAENCQRRLATPNEARAWLGLPLGPVLPRLESRAPENVP